MQTSFHTAPVTSLTIKAASFFLLAGLLVYPFTIAGSNAFFALLLATVLLFNPRVFKQGWYICWNKYRHITTAICLSILLSVLGYFWSSNSNIALHSLEKKINWLFLPLIIGLVLVSPTLLKKIFIAISIGLSAHLIVSTLQFMSVITITGNIGGSLATDPAGFIGHLSFGYIYGIWVGLLLTFASTTISIKYKIIYYTLSSYALLFIFLTQGRSGYIITLALLALVFWKEYAHNLSTKVIVTYILATIITITLLFTLNAPVKYKVQKTITEIQLYLNGDLSNSSPRLKIWAITIDIWKDNPWIGIGTGSFKEAFIVKAKSSKYQSFTYNNTTFGTPHNEYLFSLLQWGPLGLILFLYLVASIIYKGLTTWEIQPVQGYLLSSVGIAIAINAFSATPLSTGITSVASALVLAIGMSIYKPTLKI